MINLHNIYGVTGKPILHSKSPDIFNYLKDKLYLFDSDYIRIIADSSSEVIEIMKSLNLKGINITAPFKKSIMEHIDVIDDHAKVIEAVNVVENRDGKLFGYNTDSIGVEDTIKKYNLNKEGFKYLIIGSGGAGKAAAYGLVNSGLDVTIINRTNEKAKIFADKINCKYAEWENLENEINNAELCINTIPFKYLNLNKYFKKEQLVLNADYTNESSSKQNTELNGLEWLINQAVPSFKIFIKVHPELVEVCTPIIDERNYNTLFEFLNSNNSGVIKKSNIALIGFIGSGKTTIGKLLAEKLNWKFIDTDELIVQKEQIPIREIFRIHGEAYFRNLEKEVLLSIKEKKNVVISCGGGLILDDDNRDILKNISNIFWLFSPIEKCMDRLNSDLRPPLTNPFDSTTDPIEKAEILFNYRIPYYCEVADALVLNNDSISQAVDKIYEEVHTYFGY